MTVFFISDTHLDQSKILTFKDNEGDLIRGSVFNSIEEMHGVLIRNWNKVVSRNDTVYVIGDVAWNEEALMIFNAMRGKKIMIGGNHDKMNVRKYLSVFDNIIGCKKISVKGWNAILTHIPVHPDSIERFQHNIHGHLHHNLIDDPRYLNTSCEVVNYTPISIDHAIDLIKLQKEVYNAKAEQQEVMISHIARDEPQIPERF